MSSRRSFLSALVAAPVVAIAPKLESRSKRVWGETWSDSSDTVFMLVMAAESVKEGDMLAWSRVSSEWRPIVIRARTPLLGHLAGVATRDASVGGLLAIKTYGWCE